jgi:hypothetical protein
VSKTSIGENSSFSTNGTGKAGYSYVGVKLDPSLTMYKNPFKMDQRPETLKLREANIGKTLEHI